MRWNTIWKQFCAHSFGLPALLVLFLFALIGIYAPFLASSKPIAVRYDGDWYFPLFRYLFYTGFYTKIIDLFYNVLMIFLPFWGLLFFFKRKVLRNVLSLLLLCVQASLFFYFALITPKDPAADLALSKQRQSTLQLASEDKIEDPLLKALPTFESWELDLRHLSPYAKLNLLLHHRRQPAKDSLEKEQGEQHLLSGLYSSYQSAKQELPRLISNYLPLSEEYIASKSNLERQKEALMQIEERCRLLFAGRSIDSVPEVVQAQERYRSEELHFDEVARKSQPQRTALSRARQQIISYESTRAKMDYLSERNQWLAQESQKISFTLMPILRPFHWQDDVGESTLARSQRSWSDLVRINGKDLTAALIFGIRISLLVGISSVVLSLLIGVPVGALAAYYGGKMDMILCRIIEIWESMPTFFMLLTIVAIVQSKSIFLIVAALSLFGWTHFARYVRGEVLKQRNLSYVEAVRSQGFSDLRTIFIHILPNAVPPLLTLFPFAIMAAITSEAGLSFLGLGEEGTCSWGVLMDEGRTVFPGESGLLWPPAILLTLLLVVIALVGDALRDAIDPKMT